MKRGLVAVGMLMMAAGVLAGDGAKTRPGEGAVVVTGTIEADVLVPADGRGHNGVMWVRSQERADQLGKFFEGMKPERELPRVDYSKQQVLFVFASGLREGEGFTLEKGDWGGEPMTADVVLRHRAGALNRARVVDGAEKRPMKCMWVEVDFTKVEREMPYEGFNPGLKLSMWAEWGEVDTTRAKVFEAEMGGKAGGGDIVDNLQARISAKAAAVKAGEDILVDFELRHAGMGEAKEFGGTAEAVNVWDGKYLNGYRNYGFWVRNPKGKVEFLQPKVQEDWDKNAPHLVKVTAKASYRLPNWVEGSTWKSLKGLGLDTSVPGTYTIEGVYTEAGDEKGEAAGAKGVRIWAGSIASNVVQVVVK